MKTGTVDMGFEVFERREELKKTLACAVFEGLCANAEKRILCDFSAGAKISDGADLIAASAVLRKCFSNREFSGRVGLAIPPSFVACAANYACLLAGAVPREPQFYAGAGGGKELRGDRRNLPHGVGVPVQGENLEGKPVVSVDRQRSRRRGNSRVRPARAPRLLARKGGAGPRGDPFGFRAERVFRQSGERRALSSSRAAARARRKRRFSPSAT